MNRVQKSICFVFGLIVLIDSSSFAGERLEDSIAILGGTIMLDGQVEVTGGLKGDKYFELIEVSTPTTPTTNRARIFLTPGSSGKQQLSIIFDNGTAVRITGN